MAPNSEHKVVEIRKKDFQTNLGLLHLKEPIRFVIHTLYENLLGLIAKRWHFFLTPTFWRDPVANLELIDTLYGTYL